MLLLFPLLGGGHPSGHDLPRLLDEYAERSAAHTVGNLLLMERDAADLDREIVRFLLGRDLAELGLPDAGVRQLRGLLGSSTIAGGAFLALARIHNETGAADALVRDSRTAPWSQIEGEDLAETIFLVARACMATGRHPEARDWLSRIPAQSSFFPYSRYLLAQTEYALGRSSAALDAAAEVFRDRARKASERWLQERTALLVADMLIDLGLFGHAIDVLEWPSARSPFRGRAERDTAIARALMDAADGREPDDPGLDRAADDRDRDLVAAVSPRSETMARAAELERVWPPRPMRRARRLAAARTARSALDRVHGFGWRRIAQVVWRSLPTTALYDLVRSSSRGAAESAPHLDVKSRHFFTPEREVAKLLVTIALVSEAPTGAACEERFARALAERQAAALLDRANDPTGEELYGIAANCRDDPRSRRLPELREKLYQAIDAQAARLRREVREQRYRVEEAVMASRLEHGDAIGAERGERTP